VNQPAGLPPPDAIAAIDANGTFTYANLDQRANALARLVLDLGVRKGGFVGIALPRGRNFVMAMLAVFKAGGAYVPLDPAYPVERIMTRTPRLAHCGELASAVVYRMETNGVMAMPVLGDDERLAGVVHLHDLMRARVA
jgi:acyl-CoA synthetase (AMP-forming)/AMP-acid ligase II